MSKIEKPYRLRAAIYASSEREAAVAHRKNGRHHGSEKCIFGENIHFLSRSLPKEKSSPNVTNFGRLVLGGVEADSWE